MSFKNTNGLQNFLSPLGFCLLNSFMTIHQQSYISGFLKSDQLKCALETL